MGNLTPFSATGWVRKSIKVSFAERATVSEFDHALMEAVVADWNTLTQAQRDAAVKLYSCRQCVIEVSAKQECQTASFRNSDISTYLDPDTATTPVITIPDGLGGAIPSGKYVLQEISCEDTGQGGKSVVTATWIQRREWVLVKNQ